MRWKKSFKELGDLTFEFDAEAVNRVAQFDMCRGSIFNTM